jgi:hypothetical protein
VVDRASLQHSDIPWAYRRQVGRVRAFFKTVWMITSDVKSLRHEAAKPQSPSDAAAFRWWVVACLVLGFGVVIGALHTTRTRSTILRQFWSEVGAEELPRVALGLTVPWLAGVALPGAWAGYALVVVAFVARAPAAVIRTTGMAPQQVDAAQAMGAYVSAPLVLLLPAGVVFAVIVRLPPADALTLAGTKTLVLLVMTWPLLTLISLAATAHRTAQWRARVTRSGYAAGLPAMIELVLRWLVGVPTILLVVPWCVGLLRILVREFLA